MRSCRPRRRWSSTKRTSSRTWRRSTSATRAATCGSRNCCATPAARCRRERSRRRPRSPRRSPGCRTASRLFWSDPAIVRSQAGVAVARAASRYTAEIAGRCVRGRRHARRRSRSARNEHGRPATKPPDDRGQRRRRSRSRSDNDQTAHEPLRGGRRALRDDLRFLLRASDAGFVYFLERRGRGSSCARHRSTCRASSATRFSTGFRSVVLTSATLTVDRSFAYVKGRLGIREAAGSVRRVGVRLPSQALLYLPRRMPAPKHPRFAQAVAQEAIELLRRSRGRAFLLFTSYAVLRDVQRFVEMALPLPDPGPGHRAAIGADRAIPLDTERRAARHVELLAGRRRRRRRARAASSSTSCRSRRRAIR